MTDTTDAPLSRTPALFFFRQGYLAAAARFGGDNLAYNDVSTAGANDWSIARTVHPDTALFDLYLHRADSADQELRDGEAAYRAHFAADRETTGSREELATCAENLRRFGADLFPVNRNGQAHFARVIMDTVANTITASFTSTPDGDGYVLVPRHATRAMVEAADACTDAYSAYAAMVEAAHVR